MPQPCRTQRSLAPAAFREPRSQRGQGLRAAREYANKAARNLSERESWPCSRASAPITGCVRERQQQLRALAGHEPAVDGELMLPWVRLQNVSSWGTADKRRHGPSWLGRE